MEITEFAVWMSRSHTLHSFNTIAALIEPPQTTHSVPQPSHPLCDGMNVNIVGPPYPCHFWLLNKSYRLPWYMFYDFHCRVNKLLIALVRICISNGCRIYQTAIINIYDTCNEYTHFRLCSHDSQFAMVQWLCDFSTVLLSESASDGYMWLTLGYV